MTSLAMAEPVATAEGLTRKGESLSAVKKSGGRVRVLKVKDSGRRVVRRDSRSA